MLSHDVCALGMFVFAGLKFWLDRLHNLLTLWQLSP